MFLTLLLGFSSGLPIGLVGGTLQAWMKNEGVDLKTIALFSLVGLPYTIKFLWAPFMDRYVPKFLGRRRGWMLVTQVGIVLTIVAMAFSHPASSPGLLATLALCLTFFSASQDIVLDAFRTEYLNQEEYGAGSGVNIIGYRLAMLTSGGLALILADHLSWQNVYLVMAASIFVGIFATLAAKEPTVRAAPPKNIQEALIDPFVEYFSRPGSIEILFFILLFMLSSVLTQALVTPFLLEHGYTKTEIGSVIKIFGIWATMGGGLLGGGLLAIWGQRRSLYIFGIILALGPLGFSILSLVPPSIPALTAVISFENLSSGMAMAAFSAFLMNLCNKKFTATQFSLLTSLMAITRVFAGAPTGYLVSSVGWTKFFLICALSGIPGLLLLFRFPHWMKEEVSTAER